MKYHVTRHLRKGYGAVVLRFAEIRVGLINSLGGRTKINQCIL